VLAAMATGFLVMTAYAIFGGMIEIFGAPLSAPLASLAGALLALITGIAVSYVAQAPSRAEAEYREAMRNPEGESIYDRAQMRAAAAASSSEQQPAAEPSSAESST
jgi:Na+/proline symporter